MGFLANREYVIYRILCTKSFRISMFKILFTPCGQFVCQSCTARYYFCTLSLNSRYNKIRVQDLTPLYVNNMLPYTRKQKDFFVRRNKNKKREKKMNKIKTIKKERIRTKFRMKNDFFFNGHTH